ncbi:MAG: SAVED domain-containing protein [Ilumatobacteraceae bacterium]
MVGHIRDGSVEIGALEAVAAVNALAERAPELLLDPNRAGAEIDLRSLPGEDDPITSGYYATACRRITEVITERLKPAVERGEIPHLSVFGLARLPLLVFLGSRLDDTVSTGIFQRHRATESWIWDDDEPDVTFRHRVDEAGDAGSTAANLIVNASGAIDVKSIPEHLAGLPTFVIEPVDHVPNRDSIRTRATRDSFHKAVSDLLGYIEVHNKPVKALHLFAAAPASAAIILGRSVGWGFHPNLLVYDAVEGTYQLALEVTGP